MRMSSPQRTGFTLVEILTVLGIIALLVAIMLPVIGHLRERGRNATCQSNLRQISLAMQQYVADSNGIYPTQDWFTATEYGDWMGALQPYLKSTTLFHCPSQQNPAANYFYNVYQLNEYRYVKGKPYGPFGKAESRVGEASQTILNFDSLIDPPSNAETFSTSCGVHSMITLHSGGGNFSYADGHVKWLSAGQQSEFACAVFGGK